MKNLTGYEKPLEQYTKDELVQIAKTYTLYYKTASGKGSIGNYGSLTKDKLISLLKNDRDFQRAKPKTRMELLKMKIKGLTNSEDIMLEILDTLKEVDVVPDVNKFYTYVYNAKTPGLWYDQHPLIVCTDIFKWGFRGINFHWQEHRNYTWNEVAGQLHVVYYNELDDMLAIPYKKILKVGG